MKVLAITWKEAPDDPVIREQVIARSSALGGLGFDSEVLIGLAEEMRPAPEGVKVVPAPRFPILVRRIREAVHETSGNLVLLCRSPTTSLAAMLATRAKRGRCAVVYDCRGWYSAESEHRGHGTLRALLKGRLDRFVVRRVDHTVAVSPVLLGVLLSYGAHAERCSVIPPFTPPPNPGQAVPDDAVDVIYVGNSRLGYQGRERVGPIIEAIAAANREVKVGWLDSAAPTTPERLAPNLWRRRVEQDLVPAYLSRARVALLIREPDLTNAAAFPTKVAQYLAAGCRIVSSEYPPSVPFITAATGGGAKVAALATSEWVQAVSEQLALPRIEPVNLGSEVARAWADVVKRASASAAGGVER